MIPYNPSSFDTNKTILEQILELKNWLKEHPSYRIFEVNANWDPNDNEYQIADVYDEDGVMNTGDVAMFLDGYVASVQSVDRDNGTFFVWDGISIKGPQGPRGYTGRGISNIQIDGNGDLIVTIYNPETQTSTTTNAGHVVGANGTNGVDGASVTNAQVDASGDLEITIYDPATSTSTTTNAGHVKGADGVGMQIINVTAQSGTLSASDLAKATGTDDCIIIYTGNGTSVTFKRALVDSTYAYFSNVVVDGDTFYNYAEVEIATGNFTLDVVNLPIKANNINSESSTSGQVLASNGDGTASWQTASGGSTLYEHNIMIQENNFNWTARLQIISNSDTQITDKSTLRLFLSDNGFSSINNYFLGTGNYRYGGVNYLVLGLFTNSGTNLSFTTLDQTYIISQQNFWSVNVTITDIVRTL